MSTQVGCDITTWIEIIALYVNFFGGGLLRSRLIPLLFR